MGEESSDKDRVPPVEEVSCLLPSIPSSVFLLLVIFIPCTRSLHCCACVFKCRWEVKKPEGQVESADRTLATQTKLTRGRGAWNEDWRVRKSPSHSHTGLLHFSPISWQARTPHLELPAAFLSSCSTSWVYSFPFISVLSYSCFILSIYCHFFCFTSDYPFFLLSGPQCIFLPPFSFCLLPFSLPVFHLFFSVPRKFYIWAKNGSNQSSTAISQHQASNTEEFVSYQHSEVLSSSSVLVAFPSWSVQSTHQAICGWFPNEPSLLASTLPTPGPGESCPPQTVHSTGEKWSHFHQWELGNMVGIPSLSIFSLLSPGVSKTVVAKLPVGSPEQRLQFAGLDCWSSCLISLDTL